MAFHFTHRLERDICCHPVLQFDMLSFFIACTSECQQMLHRYRLRTRIVLTLKDTEHEAGSSPSDSCGHNGEKQCWDTMTFTSKPSTPQETHNYMFWITKNKHI